MGWLVVIGIVFVVFYSMGHQDGKRLGSRKGYGVGFDRGRRASSSGCLILIVALGVAMGSAAALVYAA